MSNDMPEEIYVRYHRDDGYTGDYIDAEVVYSKDYNTKYIRADLKQQDINAELLEVLKECLPRIEEIRLVDLGAVRDAEMQDYDERKILTRRELAEPNELINKISKAISRAEQKQTEKNDE